MGLMGLTGDQWGLGLLGGAAGAFPTVGNSSGTSTSNSTSNANTTASGLTQSQLESLLTSLSQLTSSTSSSVNPNLSPEHQGLINSLINKYSNLTSNPVNMGGYTTQQTQGINRNSGIQKQAVDNIMAARGVASSPVSATSDANIEAGRIAQINNMQQGVPLLQNQLMGQNLAGAAALAGAIPHGSTTTGTGFQSQTGSQTGNQTGSQNMYQTGTSNNVSSGTTNQTARTSEGGGIGGFLGGLGSILGMFLK